jgi:hypothetical protein
MERSSRTSDGQKSGCLIRAKSRCSEKIKAYLELFYCDPQCMIEHVGRKRHAVFKPDKPE